VKSSVRSIAGLALLLTACATPAPRSPPSSSAPGTTTFAPPDLPGEAAAIVVDSAQPEPGATSALPATALDRIACLRQARSGNRPYRIRLSELERTRLERSIAFYTVYQPKLIADYTVSNSEDFGGAALTANLPVLGFEIQPFLRLNYQQVPGDPAQEHTTSQGVAISRALFGIHEHLRQRLPITQAEYDLLATANRVQLDARRLDLDATRAFFALQRAERRRQVRQIRVASAKEFVETTHQNVVQGFKAPIEDLNAEIDLNQAEADLLSEETNVNDAREVLARLLGVPITTPLTITQEDLANLAVVLPDLDGDLALVSARHEDLINRALDIDLSLQDKRIQSDRLLPRITASLVLEHRQDGSAFFDDEAGNENIAALTFTWVLPLDLLANDRNRLRQLERLVSERMIALRDAQAALEQQLRGLYRRMAQFQRSVELARIRFEAEKAKLTATLARYQAAVIDNLEVTRAKADLDNAALNLLETRIGLVTAMAEYIAVLPARPGT